MRQCMTQYVAGGNKTAPSRAIRFTRDLGSACLLTPYYVQYVRGFSASHFGPVFMGKLQHTN